MKAMTLGELATAINAMVERDDWPQIAARSITVRLSTNEGDDHSIGALTSADLETGCTETLALVLDASDEVDPNPSDFEDDGRD